MLIVMLIKAGVAPYTPPAAYFAVTLQGLLGEILFRHKKLFRLSCVIFGTLTMTLSSLQKFLMLTIVYGGNLWESINSFGLYISSQFSFLNKIDNLSLWIMGAYTGVHLIAGIFTGIVASGLPRKISETAENEDFNPIPPVSEDNPRITKKKRKRKFWLKKPTALLIIFLASVIVLLSYLYPEISKSTGTKAVLMIIRSMVIMTVWFFFISPYIQKWYKKVFRKKKTLYGKDVEFITSILPVLKIIVFANWKILKGERFFKRITQFTVLTLTTIIYMETGDDEND